VDDTDLRAIFTERSVSRLKSMELNTLRRDLPLNLEGDAAYARVLFAHVHNRLPGDPSLFTDMLCELKTSGELYNPVRQFITDKEFVKDFVRARVGATYAVPTLAVLRSAAEAERFIISSDCVVKPTHLSGHVAFARAGEKFDWKTRAWWWNTDYYPLGREANYAYLQHKVIVEPILFDDSNVPDYKFFCWRGEPRVVQVDTDRHLGHRRAFFDVHWNPLPITMSHPGPDMELHEPPLLKQALELARELSRGLEFLRVDLYLGAADAYVGELTNCPGNACERFSPHEGERLFSELLFG